MREIVQEKICTALQDNQIIQNNRDLALLLQKVIIDNKHDIDLKNLKSVTSSIKDLESIANPRPDIQINNSNTQNKNEIHLEWSLL